MAKKVFRVVGIFDTETCNLEVAGRHTAIPICWIANDLRMIDIPHYEPDSPREHIDIFRSEGDFIAWLDMLIEWGLENGVTPIVCAYNLMFDMQTILETLAGRFDLEAIAQSATNAYTIDIKIEDTTVLRFWDTFHLEMGGLAAMGKTCGFSKALGDWDYSLVRTPYTQLTEQEINYARRDVQVIPAYLRWLCEANEWLNADMLGVTVLTKTSILRQFAKSQFKRERVKTKNSSYSLFQLFRALCDKESAADYYSYALRRACFRGGLTFTAAQHAAQIQYNVHSLDVVSMHHTFINGRRIPIEFERAETEELEHAIKYVLSRSIEDVLRRYDYPFYYAFHAQITFKGLRLKEGSVFDTHKIALLASSKMSVPRENNVNYEQSALTLDVDKEVFNHNFKDAGKNVEVAFSKIYSADSLTVFVTEVELWCMSRVYEWDALEVDAGELSTRTLKIPDYVTLQSNLLFERKNAFKEITKRYKEGTPYSGQLSDVVPPGLKRELEAGTVSNAFVEAYYQSTIKGQFNAIYGSMCMAEVRPEFMFNSIGEMLIDPATRINAMTYNEAKPTHSKVLYTFGMRIVAGSRMHMVIAMELLHDAFGSQIKILGGDTDSLKISTPETITPDMLIDVLQPLHEASDKAIAKSQTRVRKNYPAFASQFEGVGHFEYETTSEIHYEAWNKARIGVNGEQSHITCAGLARPDGAYTIETWCDELLKEYDAESVLPWILSYNTTIHSDICHFLEHTQPRPNARVKATIIDYRGDTFEVDEHEAIALYPQHRVMGSELARENWQNMTYLSKLGVNYEARPHVIQLDKDRKPTVLVEVEGELVRFI